MGRQMNEEELYAFYASIYWQAGMAKKIGDHKSEKRHWWVLRKIDRFIEQQPT